MSAPALPEALRAPITDLASGKAWLEALSAADLTFHLEDDPAEIVSGLAGERIFRDEDVPLLRERVASLYTLDWDVFDCPIGYTLVLCAEAGRIDYWTKGDIVGPADAEEEVVRVGVGPDRHRAILKASKGYRVVSRTREDFARGTCTYDFPDREELFSSVEDAMAEAGGLWE